MPDDARRHVLRAAGSVALVACGLAISRGAGGTSGDRSFDESSMREVLRAMGGTPVPSNAIDLDLPELTENGAIVPVTVTSRIPGTEQISILVEANPYPLAARFDILPDTEAFVATRVKLAQSGTVTAVVKADGRLYSAVKATTVTIGGCGG